MNHIFVSPLINGVLGTIAFAIALSGRFLLSAEMIAEHYILSVNGLISILLLYTILPTIFYRRFGHYYENAGLEKRALIDKTFILWVIISAAVVALYLIASETAKFASLGYIGLSILNLIRLFAIARRKEIT